MMLFVDKRTNGGIAFMDYAKIFAQNLPMEQGVIDKRHTPYCCTKRATTPNYVNALTKRFLIKNIFVKPTTT